jgi:hypothetical protein
MAQLKTLALKKLQAKAELKAFKALLDGKGQGDLGEMSDLLPFFDAHEQLCALMGMYNHDHGFSQLIDCILWIENNKGNTAYAGRFKAASIQFNMLLVSGRDRDLAVPALRERFDWRSESVVVASKKVHCITYDKLYDDLSTRLRIFGG